MTPGYGFAYFRWRSFTARSNHDESEDSLYVRVWRKMDLKHFDRLQAKP